jgi:CheY-like chemotaxis protein
MTTGRRAVILHVEDEAANRALFRAAVSRAEIIANEPIDLVLLDVRLPDGNGLDLAREIARGPSSSHPPEIIILSASVLPSERDMALATGASHFLEKPYVPSELLALITASLVASVGLR